MSVNKVILVGNVTKDPELRSTSDGREIANFSVATSEKWKDKQGKQQEKVEYHRIVVFSQGLVGIVKNYVKKGSKLYIEGSLHTRKWTDNNGVEKYSTEIVLQNFNSTLQILSSAKDGNVEEHSKNFDKATAAFTKESVMEEIDEDGIPF